MGLLGEALTFTGTLFAAGFNWFWLLVALGLGLVVGWRTAAEPPAEPPPPPERPAP